MLLKRFANCYEFQKRNKSNHAATFWTQLSLKTQRQMDAGWDKKFLKLKKTWVAGTKYYQQATVYSKIILIIGTVTERYTWSNISSLPEQAKPSPVKPKLHWQVKLPIVFVHAAFWPQLSVFNTHSSLS